MLFIQSSASDTTQLLHTDNISELMEEFSTSARRRAQRETASDSGRRRRHLPRTSENGTQRPRVRYGGD